MEVIQQHKDVELSQKQRELKDQRMVAAAYRGLMRGLKDVSPEKREWIRKAYHLARDMHKGVKRKSGEPYILHPIAVAKILVSEMGLQDPTSIVCALLHDTVEDTHLELGDIERQFGKTTRNIIDGLTKISGPLSDHLDSKQAMNFRKILLTISDDIRVILIKLADRLHNMRTLGAMRQEKMLKIASETMYIYAPLAHRLGLYELKSELEDLSFKYSQPLLYEEIRDKLAASKIEAQQFINRFVRSVRDHLRMTTQLSFTIKSRFKSIYSVYLKMERKNLPFEEIYDRYAIRVIIESRPGKEQDDCWHVYSVLSRLYKPNPKRLRDWISVPKENNYEALHTTLRGPGGRWVEVQIRTQRMDDVAEKGIAAHWIYKENGELQDDLLNQWINQVREILENPNFNALEALREFKANLQPNDVFIFTPKGEMIRMPVHSTVLDFAYKIHTDLGDSAIGAKVNHQVETLSHVLRPGDHVEILSSRRQKPKKEWLRFVQTPRAKERIKKALQKQRNEIIEQGRRLFQWRARQYMVEDDQIIIEELLAYFTLPTIEEFFYALGSHRLDTDKIAEFIRLKKEGKSIGAEHVSEWEQRRKAIHEKFAEIGIDADMLVIGKETPIDNYIVAKCCGPVPGDDIIAFAENDKRITIHRTNCPRAIALMSSFGSKIVRARWSENSKEVSFLASIKVLGLDKQGMLNDIIRIISIRMKLNIRKVTIESQDGLFEGAFLIYVRNNQELQDLAERLQRLPNVYKIERSDYDMEPFAEELKKADDANA